MPRQWVRQVPSGTRPCFSTWSSAVNGTYAASAGTAPTLRVPERHLRCECRNGTYAASAGTAPTLRVPERHLRCECRTGTYAASAGTAPTLRVPERHLFLFDQEQVPCLVLSQRRELIGR